MFLLSSGVISIYRLKSPLKVFRNRLWQTPDTTIMTEARHGALFPKDLYNEETDSTQWKKWERFLKGRLKLRRTINLNFPKL